jgi:hypothetical protein
MGGQHRNSTPVRTHSGKRPKRDRMRSIEHAAPTTKDYADYLRVRYSAVRKPKQEDKR